jgi:hypothetical protein
MSTALSRRSPRKRRITKSKPPITQETRGTGEKESTPHAPADDEASETVPVTMVATTPSQRKNGQLPVQPCKTIHHSPLEPRLGSSTPFVKYWIRIGSGCLSSKPPLRNACVRQNDLSNNEGVREEAPPEAVKVRGNTDRDYPGFRKTMLGR